MLQSLRFLTLIRNFIWVPYLIYMTAILLLFVISGRKWQSASLQKHLTKLLKKKSHTKPIFHSDRGFQYTNKKISKKSWKDTDMIQSMSRVGHCIDNGPIEGFWGIIKSENVSDVWDFRWGLPPICHQRLYPILLSRASTKQIWL